MIKYLISRIFNNKWLFLCLFISALIGCSVLSSVPLYSNAIIQRLLTKDLEKSMIETNTFPGLYTYSFSNYPNKSSELDILSRADTIINEEFIPGFNLPVISKSRFLEVFGKRIRRENATKEEDKGFAVGFVSLLDVEENVILTHGKFPEPVQEEDLYEVMLSELTMKDTKMVLGETYDVLETVFSANEEVRLFKVKVTGIFSVKPESGLYWSGATFGNTNGKLLLDNESFIDLLRSKNEIRLKKSEWKFFLDYYSIKIEAVPDILDNNRTQERWSSKNNLRISTTLMKILENYSSRKNQLMITLFILTIPLMVISAMFTFMITNLIVRSDRNEISVLKSRGAGTLQLFMLYVLEGLFVSVVAVLAGPFLSILICRIIGSSNGFLQFVNRTALDLVIKSDTFLYSLISGVIFLVCMLVPAFNACKVSIVQYKKSKVGAALKKPLWQKLFLDIILLALSGYIYYGYKNNWAVTDIASSGGNELSVDPMLYFVSTFFILGLCLFFQRIYPLVVRTLFGIGKAWWGPTPYFSLVNVGRADKNLQFIMVFLTLALGFGIMSANEARTINRNIEDKVNYELGAEVVIEPYNNLKHANNLPPMMDDISQSVPSKASDSYTEPPYQEGFKKMEGISEMTRVVIKENATVTFGKDHLTRVKVLGITPHEFGNTVWFRNDLLPRHINEYLNVMTNAPKAVYLSSNMKDKLDLEPGDEVRIRGELDFDLVYVFYGFIDYFPTLNPFSTQNGSNSGYFAVTNSSYAEMKLPVQPYEIWIKKAPGVEDKFINQQIEDRQLRIERVEYRDQKIIEKKNDPMLQGMNGVLSMCFIVTMIIVAAGFIIFWTLNIKERALMFGILRAIGMSMKGVALIMTGEQLLVSGFAAVMGFLLGGLASSIFTPLLQMVYSKDQQVPPFLVTANLSDYSKVSAIALIMLITAFIIVFMVIKRLRVNQILKLGED